MKTMIASNRCCGHIPLTFQCQKQRKVAWARFLADRELESQVGRLAGRRKLSWLAHCQLSVVGRNTSSNISSCLLSAPRGGRKPGHHFRVRCRTRPRPGFARFCLRRALRSGSGSCFAKTSLSPKSKVFPHNGHFFAENLRPTTQYSLDDSPLNLHFMLDHLQEWEHKC